MWKKEEFHTMSEIRSALVIYHCCVLSPKDLNNNCRKDAIEQSFLPPLPSPPLPYADILKGDTVRIIYLPADYSVIGVRHSTSRDTT